MQPLEPELILATNALLEKYPGAAFTLNATGYDSLQWYSEAPPKPTQEEFQQAIATYTAEKTNRPAPA